jgi:hypothetical protein
MDSKMREMEEKGLMFNPYYKVCKGSLEKNGRKISLIKHQGVINKIHYSVELK